MTANPMYTPNMILCARMLFAGVSAEKKRLYKVSPIVAHSPIAAKINQKICDCPAALFRSYKRLQETFVHRSAEVGPNQATDHAVEKCVAHIDGFSIRREQQHRHSCSTSGVPSSLR